MSAGFSTADLCDAHPGRIDVAEPLLRDYGCRRRFSGTIVTVRCYEDNSRVREVLAGPGTEQVLVVDGGGSIACALFGDRMAALAVENCWQGVVIHGCVRDTETLARIDLGIRALGANPRRSVKKGGGEVNVPVRFAGIPFPPGAFLYADADGIVVSPEHLL